MTKRELLRRLATVPDGAELFIQLPDDEPPVELSIEVFVETDHTDVIFLPMPPVSTEVWDHEHNIIRTVPR